MFNEPHRGYVELQSFHSWDYNTDLHLSYFRKFIFISSFHLLRPFLATAFESFQLGAGHPTAVGAWTRSFPMPTRRTSSVMLNPHRKSVWRPNGPSSGRCIWELHDVWGWDKNRDEGVILRENYFKFDPATGKKVHVLFRLTDVSLDVHGGGRLIGIPIFISHS